MAKLLIRLSTVLALALSAGFFVFTQAQGVSAPSSLREKLALSIEAASGNQLQIVGITASALGTIYEVELNTGEVLYADASGDYLFAGDMFQTTTTGLINLSASKRQLRTLDKITAIPEDEMIIFSPDSPDEIKATLTVFTDVDCQYCRALHRDMDQLLAKGIQVRYLAYPRGGENAGSYEKMISVWCSDDRHKSLTQAKNGQNLPAETCDSPVMAHYALGNELGITGTPAIIMPDGRLVPGYADVDYLSALAGVN
ncbi:MAG: DsbC family protein [Gammaproteobacteria bacterium]|nr:DsbC family protein [Gammaproteobacteria bacterium]MDP7455129.1 DsbC family protein [Gammaproteobacteria bacterium]